MLLSISAVTVTTVDTLILVRVVHESSLAVPDDGRFSRALNESMTVAFIRVIAICFTDTKLWTILKATNRIIWAKEIKTEALKML